MDNKRKPYLNLTEEINSQYGKLPPQAIEAEQAVLGALLLERDAYHKVASILNTEVFYKEEHRLIFELVDHMHTSGKTVDLVTVTQRAKEKNILENVGGPLALTQLTSRVATAAHIEHHARIIYDKFVQREMIKSFSILLNMAYDPDTDELDMIYSQQTQHIDDLLTGNSGMSHIRDIMKRTTKEIEDRQKKAENNEIPGIHTGLADLNKKTNGWQAGDLIVVAGRPGMGKTAFALHFAKGAAKSGKAVCIFSLEMTDTRLSERMILSNGGIEQGNLKSGRMTEEDWTAYHHSVGELEKLNIFMDDSSAVHVKYITAVARNKARRGECDMVVIDYLQLVKSPDSNSYTNREREVAIISSSLKELAKSIDVPVILLAQLNRAVEHRVDKKPTLADLRESGAIEQDADMVIFPWRPEYYDPEGEFEDGTPVKNFVQLIISKYREGSPGAVSCKKADDFTQIFDSEPPKMPEEFQNYHEKEEKF